MCGIAGFVGRAGTAEWNDGSASARLAAMCDAIRHRGPDDWGSRVSDGAAIGMRRLSIIDVAGGHQPIPNEDGSVHVVFNGEIYNFRDLQSRLRALEQRHGRSHDRAGTKEREGGHGFGCSAGVIVLLPNG